MFVTRLRTADEATNTGCNSVHAVEPVGFALSGDNFKGVLDSVLLLIFVIPVVAASLVWYRLLYLRPKQGEA